jgi:hypothetical protein
MRTFKLIDIEEIAETILSCNPGSVVKYLLLRDVMRRPPGCKILQEAKRKARFAEYGLEQLWELRSQYGLWDFNSNRSGKYFVLSDNWRRPINRRIDLSTKILSLLRRYFD